MSNHRGFDPPTARDFPPVAEREDRACNGKDPLLFYPKHNAATGAALDVCWRGGPDGGECPHRQECLDWAVSTEQSFGVWGGTTAEERYALIRRRKA